MLSEILLELLILLIQIGLFLYTIYYFLKRLSKAKPLINFKSNRIFFFLTSVFLFVFASVKVIELSELNLLYNAMPGSFDENQKKLKTIYSILDLSILFVSFAGIICTPLQRNPYFSVPSIASFIINFLLKITLFLLNIYKYLERVSSSKPKTIDKYIFLGLIEIILGFLLTVILTSFSNKTNNETLKNSKKKKIAGKVSFNKTVEFKYSLLSQALFFWVDRLFWCVGKKSFRLRDFPELNYKERSVNTEEKIKKTWYPSIMNKDSTENNLLKLFRLIYTYKKEFLVSIFIKSTHDVSEIVSYLLITKLFETLRYKTIPIATIRNLGNVIALAYLFGSVVAELILNIYFKMNILVGIKLKQGLVKLIYDQTLAGTSTSSESPANLISQDIEVISELMTWVHCVWSLPFQLIVLIFIVYSKAKSAVFWALGAVVVLIFPSNWLVSKFSYSYKQKMLKVSDQRVKMVSEFVKNIKILKLYGWNLAFAKKIAAKRAEEKKLYSKMIFIDEIWGLFWILPSMLLKGVTLGIFLYKLTPSEFVEAFEKKKAIGIMLLISRFQFPLGIFSLVIFSLVNSSLGIKRITNFLSKIKENSSKKNLSFMENKKEVEIRNCQFSFPHDETHHEKKTFLVRNLEINKGEKVAIVGSTGSGKSTLLSILINKFTDFAKIDENEESVYIFKKSPVGFSPQSPWVFSGTLRENVLFGEPFEAEKYQKVLKNLKLLEDLDTLSQGDQTLLGQSGFQLSGGQQQRLNMARAFYSDTDFLILDDCLSGLDANVGEAVFKEAVLSVKNNKTVLLVTNKPNHALRCDKVVLVENCEVKKVGKPSEIMLKDICLPRKIAQTATVVREKEIEAKSQIQEPKISRAKNEIDIDESPKITFADRKFWIQGIGGCFVLSGLLLFSILGRLFDIVASKIIDAPQNVIPFKLVFKSFFLSLLTAFFLNLYFEVLKNMVIFIMFRKNFSNIHSRILFGLSGCKLDKLDSPSTNPGALINRFTNDLNPLDFRMAMPVKVSVLFLINLVVSLSNVVTEEVKLLPLILVFFCFSGLMFYLYIKQIRAIKTLYNKSMSSVYGNIVNTEAGLSVIHAMEKQEFMKENLRTALDTTSRINYVGVCVLRWLATRFGVFVPLITTSVILYFVNWDISSDKVSLIVYLVLDACSVGRYFVQYYSEAEKFFVNIKRLREVADLEQEEHIGETCAAEAEKEEGGLLLVFDNVTLEVAEGQKLLKDLNFTVRKGEKVGIVGRTGAGKSTLLSTVLRVMEPTKGKVILGRRNIADLRICDLRRKVSIIPQNPAMFDASLKYNLDPLDECSDEELQKAVKLAHLENLVKRHKNGILFEIKENGSNLSLGEKQLVCLGRALTRKSNVLLIDEATASLDAESDQLIQRTLRESFSNTTILTVAHRIETVLDYDKILVLDKGELKEFASPNKLLKDKNSLFSQLYNSNKSER